MASTSTNKIPMMTDRPFLRSARLASQVASYSNATLSNVVQLLRVGDLPSQDGALIEDIWLQNMSYSNYYATIESVPVILNVYAFLPDSSAPGSYAIFPLARVEKYVTSGTAADKKVVIGVATNVVQTSVAHGLVIGDIVQFAATNIPIGATYGTPYVVDTAPATDKFSLKTLSGGAVALANTSTPSAVWKYNGVKPEETGKLGEATHLKLPWVMAPVPRFKDPSSDLTNKFEGLYLEKGHILGVAIDEITGPIQLAPGGTGLPGFTISCQGAFY